MEEKKKISLISKLFSFIGYFFIFLFPSFKLLSLNKFLSKGYAVEKDKWFLKQKQRNIILSILFIIPLIFTFYKSYNILVNDANVFSRIGIIYESEISLFNKIKNYGNVIVILKDDSLLLKEQKFETQARILASVFVFTIGILTQLFIAILITKFHPLITETNKLKKLLIGPIISKENENKNIVFATPIGFLIDITGSSPDDVVRQKSIWDALNLTVRDYSRDSSQRSLVFFRKEFELQENYLYDRL